MDKKYDIEDVVNHITNLWGEGAGSIDKGEVGKGYYTKQEKKYFRHFKNISKFNGGNVIEVGPGTGKFALMLMQNFNIKNYTILDIKKNIKDSMKLFEDNKLSGIFIESKDYKKTFNESYDLFVSNMCLSEVPSYYREDIFENVLPNCKNVFIIDGYKDKNIFNDWLKESIEKYFKFISIEETTISNCFAISGHNYG